MRINLSKKIRSRNIRLRSFAVFCSLIATIAMFTGLIVFPTSEVAASAMQTSDSVKQKVGGDDAVASIAGMLDESGRIKPGTEGSFDPRGYRMVFGDNGSPTFVPQASSIMSANGGVPGVAVCSDNWDSRFGNDNGVSDAIFAIAVSGTDIYVGGFFQSAGLVEAYGIAKWDGTSWSALGSGLNSGVIAIAVSGSDVYAGGYFTQVGGISTTGIAKWDGASWSALGSGVNSTVNVIAVSGSDVYVGGYFTAAGGAPASGVAKWNGTSWSTLGSGVNGGVAEIEVSGSDVYVGGSFTTAGGSPANNIAKWNGSSWSSLGLGLNDQVNGIEVSGSDVYVGGFFFEAGGSLATGVAKWDGTSWSALGSGVDGTVYSIALVGSDLYVGGFIVSAGGLAVNDIAKWNGTSWSALGSGVGSDYASGLMTIAVSGSDLYVGGFFDFAEGFPASSLAKWDGTSWKNITAGDVDHFGFRRDHFINSIAVSGSDVYVGGQFSLAGGVQASRVAKWNGTSWSALGDGVDGTVYAVTVSGSDVYVGGSFTNAGGVPANGVAKWNGTSWSALGGGVDAIVYAIAVSGSDVYVGGNFTSAAGAPADRVAKWNGTSWSALGSGASGDVRSIAVSGSDVYVGGEFINAGGVEANGFAKWNGTAWSVFGMSSGTRVQSIVASASDVYIGGSFTAAGGVPARGIAKWDGTTWSSLGDGLDSFVNSVAVSGSDVFVVGSYFTSAGGVPAKKVAKWDGSSWSRLGSGLSGEGYAVAVSGSNVYVGGFFGAAGCSESSRFARYFDKRGFTAAADSDWNNPVNWESGAVPSSVTDAVVSGGDAVVSGALTEVRDLQVNRGRKLTVPTGSKLFVYGTLTLDGEIDGDGEVHVVLNHPNTVTRTGPGYVKANLSRPISSQGRYTFQVGTASGYSPVIFDNITQNERLVVKANSGAYSSPATGLTSNKLPRWWRIELAVPDPDLRSSSLNSPTAAFQADLTFGFPKEELTLGNPALYKAWRISGGVATNAGGALNADGDRLTVSGVSQFSDWTLAEIGPTAATAAIGGKVLDPSGRPVANASVIMTKPDGTVVTVKTNNFGSYRFTGIAAGETYIVMAQTRRYMYTPKVVTLSEDLNALDFTP